MSVGKSRRPSEEYQIQGILSISSDSPRAEDTHTCKRAWTYREAATASMELVTILYLT